MGSNDDCYFFFYSTCNKGDLCPFRHEEAALGNEVTCSLWQEGRCHRKVCFFRHMEIKKDRNNIPCYWESQPGGCQKPHCVFLHGGQGNAGVTQPPEVPGQYGHGAATRPGGGNENYNASISSQPYADSGQMFNYDQTPAPFSPSLPHGQHTVTTPITPKVEPVLINFDEETDEESVVGTPVKKPPEPLKEVSVEGPKTVSLKKNTADAADSHQGAGDSLDFQIKSLDEIRSEKRKQTGQLAGGDAAIYEEYSDFNADSESKTIKIGSTESSVDVGVKSLEEIRREKALQSLKEAQKAKAKARETTAPERRTISRRAEAYEGDIECEVDPTVSRRIIVAEEEKTVEKPKSRIKDRIGIRIKDRLGNKSDDSADEPPKLSAIERLGGGVSKPRKINLKSKITTDVPEQKDKVTITRKIALASNKKETNEIGIKSLAEIRKVKTSSKLDERKVVSAVEKQASPVQSRRIMVSYDDLGEVKGKSSIEIKKPRKKISPIRTTVERKNREPKIQIYRPPPLKRKAPAEKLEKEVADVSPPKEKKTSKWGAKTFSEIMKEKQMRLREKKEYKEDERLAEKREERFASSTANRAFSPISFDDNKSVKRPKSVITPIVFDDKPSKATVKKPFKRSPIKFDKEEETPIVSKRVKVVTSKVVPDSTSKEDDLAFDAPLVSISPVTVGVKPGADSVKKAGAAGGSSPVKSPQKITLKRNRSSSEKPVPRRRCLRASSSTEKLKLDPSQSTSSVQESDDFDLDKEFEDILDDSALADIGSSAEAADDDDLLQEMEELLA